MMMTFILKMMMIMMLDDYANYDHTNGDINNDYDNYDDYVAIDNFSN